MNLAQNKTINKAIDKGAISITNVAFTPKVSIVFLMTSLVSIPADIIVFTIIKKINPAGKIKNKIGCDFNFLACSMYIV